MSTLEIITDKPTKEEETDALLFEIEQLMDGMKDNLCDINQCRYNGEEPKEWEALRYQGIVLNILLGQLWGRR